MKNSVHTITVGPEIFTVEELAWDTEVLGRKTGRVTEIATVSGGTADLDYAALVTALKKMKFVFRHDRNLLHSSRLCSGSK